MQMQNTQLFSSPRLSRSAVPISGLPLNDAPETQPAIPLALEEESAIVLRGSHGAVPVQAVRRVTAYATAHQYDIAMLIDFIDSHPWLNSNVVKRVQEMLFMPFQSSLVDARVVASAARWRALLQSDKSSTEWQTRREALIKRQKQLFQKQKTEKSSFQTKPATKQRRHSFQGAVNANESHSATWHPSAAVQKLFNRKGKNEVDFVPEVPSDLPVPMQTMPPTRMTVEMRNQLDPGQVFVFDYGVVVMWGLHESTERILLQFLSAFALETSLDEEQWEIEPMQYFLQVEEDESSSSDDEVISVRSVHSRTSSNSKNRSISTESVSSRSTHSSSESCAVHMADDLIAIRVGVIQGDDENTCRNAKMALSHALAQSTKLGYYEKRVESWVHVGGAFSLLTAPSSSWWHRIWLPKKVLSNHVLQLTQLRVQINLVSNLLDTPDVFWHASTALTASYAAAREYLEVASRVQLLNHRTGVVSEMLDMFKDRLTSMHSTYLETVLIVMTFLQVIMAIMHYFRDRC